MVTTLTRGPTDPDAFRVKVRGSRWYVDKLPFDGRWEPMADAVPAVTTVKKAWSKPFRKKTGTGLVVSLDAYQAGEFVARNIDELANLDHEAIAAKVATAPDVALARAADRGTGVHTVLEALALGQPPVVDLLEEDVKPYVEACERFVREWRPKWRMSEVVAFNRNIGFAGTCDAVIELPGLGLVEVDWKTRGEKHGAYEEEACQLGGYAGADYFIVEDEQGVRRVDVPDFDCGAIVSLCPDGTYQVYPVDIEEAQLAFLSLFETWRQRREGERLARKSIGLPLTRPPALSLNAGNGADDRRQDDGDRRGSASDLEDSNEAGADDEAKRRHAEDESKYRTHYTDRIRAIVEALNGRGLPVPWPESVPTLKSGEPINEFGWSLIDQFCVACERELSLPFLPPVNEHDVSAAARAEATVEAEPAIRPDPNAEARSWAERGKALLSLLDDEPLGYACAVIAAVESGRMDKLKFLALQAIVTQVSSPSGVLVAKWAKDGAVTVTAVDDIELALIAQMPTTDIPKTTATKAEALRRAKNVAKRLGRKAPRSFSDLCADLCLAACVAVGHGITDSNSST